MFNRKTVFNIKYLNDAQDSQASQASQDPRGVRIEGGVHVHGAWCMFIPIFIFMSMFVMPIFNFMTYRYK